MTHKISLAVCMLLISFGSFAQANLNSYKYVIVPKQYEFQKKPDSYQINSLHKFLFEKAGFEAMFSDEEYPQDLSDERCLALTSKVISNPSLFKTRFTVELYDCYNKLVYKSAETFSTEKDYTKAYHETLRLAMADLIEDGHQYDASGKSVSEVTAQRTVEKTAEPTATATIAATKIEPAKKVAEEVKEEAVETAVEVAAVTVPTVAVATKEEVKKETPKVVEVKAPSIEGTYNIDMWGACKVVKKGDAYAVVGGDEDFEFATITPTSNPSIFMLKKTGFKQVQLLELDGNGDIKIDTGNGFKTYKRVN